MGKKKAQTATISPRGLDPNDLRAENHVLPGPPPKLTVNYTETASCPGSAACDGCKAEKSYVYVVQLVGKQMLLCATCAKLLQRLLPAANT